MEHHELLERVQAMEDSVGMIANTEAYKNDTFVPRLDVQALNEASKIKSESNSKDAGQEILDMQNDLSGTLATFPGVDKTISTPGRELNIKENNQ